MKPQAEKRLDQLIFRQRLKYAAMALSGAFAVLAFMLFVGYWEEKNVDRVIRSAPVHGIIEQARLKQGGSNIYQLRVRLEDGRFIKAYSLRSAGIPYRGERIDLVEMVHRSGLKDYRVTHLFS